MRMPYLAVPLCLVGMISSTVGALAAPAEVLAAVNLRTGPGAHYYAIMVLPPGAPVEIYGCLADDSWCDVGYGDTRGWMASRYLGAVRSWSPEQQIMRPPVFSPPPIYREPPVYANPPPVYREPEWDEQYPTDVYIAPPPTYVYRPPIHRPPVTVAPPVASGEVYPTRPMLEPSPSVAARPAMPPLVASPPPTTARAVPTAPSLTTTQPTTTTTPTTTAPSAPQPATTAGQTVATSGATPLATPAPAATVVKPKYGSAVGKPGAPCKWVNGVCRND
ncbi:MAG: bacterial domain protein [Proteobacteria bacterium]|nr:bacterial domain protein [Pseudomonadota bacterium]